MMHTCAIKSDGTLWGWGENSSGELGDGSRISRLNPVHIGRNPDWEKISAGHDCSMAIRKDGTLWAWGGNFLGELGDGTEKDRSSPTIIQKNRRWVAVAAGSALTLAIASDQILWAWGRGYNYSFDLGKNSYVSRPLHESTQMVAGEKWKAVAAGPSHILALRADGVLWAWGPNVYGELGQGPRF